MEILALFILKASSHLNYHNYEVNQMPPSELNKEQLLLDANAVFSLLVLVERARGFVMSPQWCE